MKRSREPEESDSHPREDSIGSKTSLPQPAAKVTELDPSAISDDGAIIMRCHFPPHREALGFRTYDAYETHYTKYHINRCAECARNFPSDHFLSLHIEECHDPLVAVKREKGDHTFSCFVEDCERKCRTPQKRRLHLIDKHMYPKNFFFAVTKAGIDGRRSLLSDNSHRRRRSSTTTTTTTTTTRPHTVEDDTQPSKPDPAPKSNGTAMEEDPKPIEPAETAESGSTKEPQHDSGSQHPRPQKPQNANERPDTEMEDLAGALSSLRFVPPSIRFGRGRGRTGFARS